MRLFAAVLLCTFLILCGAARIDYTPDLSNVNDPISTLKATLEQQPPAYAYVPVKVEVNDQMIALYLVEGGIPGPFNSGASSIIPTILYYKNLGKPVLSKSTRANVYHVQIIDKRGNDLYWVVTLEETEAKAFYNALYYMIIRGNPQAPSNMP